MNAQAFRHLYAYHFAENRKLWETGVRFLTAEQFTRPVDYSRGSVRDQVLHLIEADQLWFAELRGALPGPPPPAASGDDRDAIRAGWDRVEQEMRAYLSTLSDEGLFARPIVEPEEDRDLVVWQVLFHVLNHGTDHRAQLLRLLHDLGAPTESQDYIFYVYDHPWPARDE